MNAVVGLFALIVVALVGWAIAEFKYKTFTFTRSEKDIEEEACRGFQGDEHPRHYA